MLQRAASNAYSWWVASHIRTKQSKWLEQSLQDMEEKVSFIVKLLSEEGDSFAKRAEMYYKKRPEILTFVEEFFRAYRALAERFDHISKELQNANNTLASAFPDQFQFAMEDDDEFGSPKPPSRRGMAYSNQKTKIPSVPKQFPTKNIKAIIAIASKTGNVSRALKKPGERPGNKAVEALRAGFNKKQAIEEIDKLQKKILTKQTEKEFTKSSYESGVAKYWQIEKEITEMQEKVSNLQDGFGVGKAIEDNEARNLMLEAALKSCQQKLAELQEKQARSVSEAEEERRKIISAKEKIQSFKGEEISETGEVLTREVNWVRSDFDEENAKATKDIEMLRDKLKEHFDGSVSEMVEKIDELVNKVITLESSVSSQDAMIRRMREESEELQTSVQVLEDGNGKDVLNEKVKEIESKLRGIQELENSVHKKNSNLKTEFTEASTKLNLISQKLPDLNLDEEIVESEAEPGNDSKPVKATKTEDEPNWQQMFKEETEKEIALRHEYSSVLANYEEVKKKLGEVEGKSEGSLTELNQLRDSLAKKDEEIWCLHQKLIHSESEDKNEDSRDDELNELRDSNAKKDEEIQSLRDKVHLQSEYSSVLEDKSNDSIEELQSLREANAKKDEEIRSLREKLILLQVKMEDHNKNTKEVAQDDDDFLSKLMRVEEPREISAVEAKLRADIDEILEDNLDFWMRFSSSFSEVQKFHSEVQDLQQELIKIQESDSLKSDSRAIYKHLKEIQTELTVWMERSMTLKTELQCRFSQLCHIQEQITQALNDGAIHDEMQFTSYQAAKFQGEVLNMQQENNKVGDELQASLDNVRSLQIEVEKTVDKLNQELGMSASNSQSSNGVSGDSGNKNQVPLRSFIFGVKPKKQKPFFSVPPSLHKKYQQFTS
ncbi:hypothetical protein V2J09_001955 [Rumex salicifolius]